MEDYHVKEGMKLLDEKLNQKVEIPKDGPIDINTFLLRVIFIEKGIH
ncbi:hypothetical protein OAJ14_07620 [Polaribacter sp.]|nr:hypothetical protein [Polaribacter sp.]